MEIKDSGDRREFDTGAVRDRAVGKGLPALISAPLMIAYMTEYNISKVNGECEALEGIYKILKTGDWNEALDVFAVLAALAGPVTAIRRLSVQLEKGALKYSKRNWEKGMPLEEYCNSAIRHILAMINGEDDEDDEDHYAAALFNVMGLWHTGYMISIDKLPAELGLDNDS